MSGNVWTTLKDVHVGMVLASGPYKGAKITKVSKNGWVRGIYRDRPKNEWFSARVHWLQLSVA